MALGPLPAGIDEPTPARSISPTDVSQFLRLDQCERYLHLRLRERAVGSTFLRDYGVAPQSIPPLLTRSGATFEQAVEDAVARCFDAVPFSDEQRRTAGRDDDNEPVVELARSLAAGSAVVLLQPRLQVALAGWRLRGDVDLLRLERDDGGRLRALIADAKSSTGPKVEHRLQVAFYREMLAALLAEAGVPVEAIEMAVLYRGPAASAAASPEEGARPAAQRDDAERCFGTCDGLLERVDDPDAYLGAVRDLVTGPHATARRVAAADLADVPYHLGYKCDGCLYNEFCMKWSAEHDDLSLLPHLSEQDKGALRRAGVATTRELATLKAFRTVGEGGNDGAKAIDLVPAPGKEPLARALAATWPVGPRVDELVHRARRYRRFKGDPLEALSYIPRGSAST